MAPFGSANCMNFPVAYDIPFITEPKLGACVFHNQKKIVMLFAWKLFLSLP